MGYSNLINRSGLASNIPVEYSSELLDMVATEGSHVMRLAKRLGNMSQYQKTMPVISALPTAYFVTADTGLKQTTSVSWEDKTIYAEELAVIVPIPESVLSDSDIDIWGEVRPLVAEALGIAIDNAVLWGTNAPSTWPTAIQTAASSASHNVSIAGADDVYDAILGEDNLFGLVEEDGFMVTGSLAHLTMKGKLRGARDSNGQPILNSDPAGGMRYILDGAPLYFPLTGVASATYMMVSGQWDQLVYSMRQDVTWKLLDQAVIQDAAGNIVYNLAQQDMVALRAVMRLGFQMPNPINRLQETAANRYPFAYLTA